jgi:hypothetical protein
VQVLGNGLIAFVFKTSELYLPVYATVYHSLIVACVVVVVLDKIIPKRKSIKKVE